MSDLSELLKVAEKAHFALTAEEVPRMAELAHLELTPEELPRMVRDLNAILGYVAQMNELDPVIEDVPPMAQVGEILGLTPAAHGESLRVDAIRPSLDRAAVMNEAPETDSRFFKVPKVIER